MPESTDDLHIGVFSLDPDTYARLLMLKNAKILRRLSSKESETLDATSSLSETAEDWLGNKAAFFEQIDVFVGSVDSMEGTSFAITAVRLVVEGAIRGALLHGPINPLPMIESMGTDLENLQLKRAISQERVLFSASPDTLLALLQKWTAGRQL